MDLKLKSYRGQDPEQRAGHSHSDLTTCPPICVIIEVCTEVKGIVLQRTTAMKREGEREREGNHNMVNINTYGTNERNDQAQ